MSLRVTVTVLLAVVLTGSSVRGGRIQRETLNVDAEGASRLDIGLEFSSGELRIESGNVDEAIAVEMSYDPRKFEYDHSYRVRKGTGRLVVESFSKKDKDLDTGENRWDVTLPTKYPLSLSMDIGACDADLDLGRLRLEMLTLNVGAAAADIEFSEPNPVRLAELDIDAGAASLELIDVGNANFEYLTFSGGVGSFDLDLRGKYSGEAHVDLDVGLGSMDVVLPRGIPVRVETDGSSWLSSIDLHNDNLEEVDDGVYESPDFDAADVRIIITVDVGLGSVDLFWRR